MAEFASEEDFWKAAAENPKIFHGVKYIPIRYIKLKIFLLSKQIREKN